MKKIIKLTVILLLAITSQNTFAQNCHSIRDKAIQMESNLDKTNPKTYFDYAMYIRSQVVANNNCLNKNIIDSVYNLLVDGANSGSIRSAARLAMISEYGLYNYPTDRARAFELSGTFLQLASITYNEDPDLYNEFGYIIPTLYLHNYLQYSNLKEISDKKAGLVEAVFSLFKLGKAPVIKNDDLGSYKKVKNDYQKVWAHAYLSGQFNTPVDYSKGIKIVNKIDKSYRDKWIRKILQDHLGEPAFSNPAGLVFLGAKEAQRWYFDGDVHKYSNLIYQTNINRVDSKSSFKKSYQNIGAPLKQIIDAAYPDYASIDKKWELVNTSKLKESEAYPQWKYLPSKDQNTLYREALKEENSSLKEKEKFQVFKAMVETGQKKAILSLANSYKLGKGVFPMGNKALETYKKALQFKSLKEEAAFNIAEIYDGSLEDVEVNWEEAAKYYKMSVNYHPKAYAMLGEMALFGVGGFSENKIQALEYLTKSYDNGGSLATKNKIQIINLIPFEENRLETENFSLSIDNPEELRIRTITNEHSLTMTVSYDVPQGLDENTLKLSPSKSHMAAIQYGTWSPSTLLEGQGQEKVIIYNNNFKRGSRQIGLFVIKGVNQDEEHFTFQIPVAVCFLPQK